MIVLLQVVLMLLCLLGSAFFAGVETGVISINRLRLHHLVRRQVRGARILQDFINKPDVLLGTTLVGTNLCHVVTAILAASLGARWGGAAGATAMGVLVTLVILVGCEFIPKAWFQSAPARNTLPFAGVLRTASLLLEPLSWAVNRIVSLVLPAPPPETHNAKPLVSREELIHLAHEGEREGMLTPQEHRMIHGVFQLRTRTCGEIMIPRHHVTTVNCDTPIPALMQLAREKDYGRFPVYDPAQRAFVGAVYVFDVMLDPAAETKTVADFMRPPQFVAHNTPVDHLLPRMRVTRQSMGMVMDEGFEVIGLVTLEDVLQEIVGRL